MTYQPNDRVRLTVPGVFHDGEDYLQRLGVTLVFHVLRHDDESVEVIHKPTGRNFWLPAKQLTKVGNQ